MNYGSLRASVARWANRTDLAADIPLFIELAEARIARDVRIGAMVKAATVTVLAGASSAALPVDYVEGQGLSDQSGCRYVPPGQMAQLLGTGDAGGTYSLYGGNLVLGAATTTGAAFSLLYYAKPATLVNDSDTNAVLTAHPGLYLFAALAEMMVFLSDDQRILIFEAKYKKEAQDAQWSSYGANFFGAEQTAAFAP